MRVLKLYYLGNNKVPVKLSNWTQLNDETVSM